MKKKISFVFWGTALMMIFISSSMAAEGGYSNYIPGTYGDFAAAVEPPTKWTVRNDYYHYNADESRSILSGQSVLDADIEFNMYFLTVLYKPELQIFGGQYAVGAFLPAIVNVDIEAGINVMDTRISRQDDTTKFGDATLIPAVIFWNKGNFHFTFAEYIVTPTSDYDKDNLANAGLNYWTFDTNVAVTYLNEEKGQDYSINIGYSYNTENSDTDYKTGQEIHIDYMVNQFFSESFAVGLHGFFLKQITGDSGDGATLGDFKAEAAGIGPAILWSTQLFGHEATFIAKWLHEYHAENRLDGNHVMVSLAMSF